MGARILVVAVLVAATLLTATPGWAAEDPVPAPQPPPADVVTFAHGPGLSFAQATIETDRANEANSGKGPDDELTVPDFSGTLHSATPREVYLFSAAFLAGQGGADQGGDGQGGDGGAVAVRPSAQWIAPVLRDSEVLGTMIIWKPQGTPEVSHVDGDAELGTALTGMDDDELFIMDERTAEYFALRGDSVRPLNGNARRELASPASLAELRTVIAARIRAVNEQSKGMDASGGGGISGGQGAGASEEASGGQQNPFANRWLDGVVLAAFLIVVLVRLARKRSH